MVISEGVDLHEERDGEKEVRVGMEGEPISFTMAVVQLPMKSSHIRISGNEFRRDRGSWWRCVRGMISFFMVAV